MCVCVSVCVCVCAYLYEMCDLFIACSSQVGKASWWNNKVMNRSMIQ